MQGLELWACPGSASDKLITLTEGVIPHEQRGDREPLDIAGATVSRPGPDRILIEVDPAAAELPSGGSPLRLGACWDLLEGERLTGLGARHGLDFDKRDRCVQLGADRRYTGPDCPPEFLENGGIPQGD